MNDNNPSAAGGGEGALLHELGHLLQLPYGVLEPAHGRKVVAWVQDLEDVAA